MRRSQSLIGQAITRPCGEQLGIIRDLILDHHQDQVIAFIAHPPQAADRPVDLPAIPMAGEPVVPFEAIFELHPDRLVVVNRDDLVPLDRLPRLKAARARSLHLGDAQLLQRDGTPLGTIHGVRFDEDTGQLLGYEIATGAPDCSQLVVPARQVSFVTEDVALASEGTAFLLQQVTAGGQRQPEGSDGEAVYWART